MNKEELEKYLILIEHGYYDDKVLKFANLNKPNHVDYYYICNEEMLEFHKGECLKRQRYNLLNYWRKRWFFHKFKEFMI